MSQEFDLNGAIEQVQQMLSSKEGEAQIQNLLGMLSGGGEDGNQDGTSPDSQDGSGFNPADLLSGMGDIQTLIKIKNIMSAVGNQRDDSKAAFLNSLKPFLKKERQEKLEMASKMLSVAKAVRLFKDLGGD